MKMGTDKSKESY